MQTLLSCRAARRELELLHDGELGIERQVVVEAHVARCTPCREWARALAEVRSLVRAAVPPRAVRGEWFETLPAAVVSRHQAEVAQTLGSRVDRMFEDMHLVWAGLAGATAILFCATTIFGLVYLAAPSRADSLFGIMRALAEPGPTTLVVGVDAGIRLPRVSADAAMPLVLGAAGAGGPDTVFALSGIVTDKGRIADLQLLQFNEADRELLLQVLRAASAAHFEPGRIGGAPIAMNLIWLLAHTTVRGGGDGVPEAALRVAGPRAA